MAFAKRIGSMFTQSLLKSSGQSARPSSILNAPSSIFNTIRCMSSSKLFVGGLPWGVDDQSLRDFFAEHGEITEARVILDRDSGRSRGFGFVNFVSEEQATSALQLDGSSMQGRNIRVNYATERTGGSFGTRGGYTGDGGGYGSGGGGYGGGYGGGGDGGYGPPGGGYGNDGGYAQGGGGGGGGGNY